MTNKKRPLNEAQLRHLYLIEKKTIAEIGQIVGRSAIGKLGKRMKAMGIPIRSQKETPRKKRGQYNMCPQCEIKFYVYQSTKDTRRYCSKICQDKATPKFSAIVQCEACNVGVKRTLKELKRVNSKQYFCSVECGRIGHSAYWQGISVKDWDGYKTNDNDRVRATIEYNEWRTAVFKRDNYTCVECSSSKSGTLNAHHIHPRRDYPELIFDINNGVTLCKSCHEETYGKEYEYIHYFNNKLEPC